MTRRYVGAEREPWPWWRRLGIGVHKVAVQPWLDAQGNGSIPAVLSGLLGGAIAYRLVTFAGSIGWPEAWIVFSCFLGVAVYEAAMTVARLNPEKLLDLFASKLGVGEVGQVNQFGSTGPANDGAPGGDLSD